MMFSARVSRYEDNSMLNICDAGILGSEITQGDLTMRISEGCYGGSTVGADEAAELLRISSIINMAGADTVSLSIRLGIGSEDGVRKISGIPFLIVFKT